MKKIKPFIGYLPILIILIPCVAAYVRQSLYYKGCMDGFGFMLTAMFAFAVGGILNVVFLGLSVIMNKKYFNGLDGGRKIIAKIAIYLSGITLAIQLYVIM